VAVVEAIKEEVERMGLVIRVRTVHVHRLRGRLEAY
jgi:hypothetical protein